MTRPSCLSALALFLSLAQACGYDPRPYQGPDGIDGAVAGTGGATVFDGGGPGGSGGLAGTSGKDAPLSPYGSGGGIGSGDAGDTALRDAPLTAAGGAGGPPASGGSVGAGGVTASGGTTDGASGGATASNGGATGTGGLTSLGGAGGLGGNTSTGGSGGLGAGGSTVGDGGATGTGGTTAPACSPACTAEQDCINSTCVPSNWGGMTCSTQTECPSWAVCCNGAEPGCDSTRLPAGDGTNIGEFVVSTDGLTVTDTITGLTWQRDSLGMRDGCTSTDNGTGTPCTWNEANAYCALLNLGGMTGWHLPSILELSTIVDYTRRDPCIDPVVFPNTPMTMFWTSSPYTGGLPNFTYKAGIFFDSGYTSHGSTNTDQALVRCVR